MNTAWLKRTNLLKVTLVAAAAMLAACLLALVGIEKPAGAAFPGQNGKIAFMSTRDFNPEIYTMDADGSNQINLTNNPASDQQPAWSPDGSQIAFTSSRDGNSEIYVMDADGSNVVRLTNNPAVDIEPAWSPDSSQIAFTSIRDGDFEIYVMDADGSNVVRLTNNPDTDAAPEWSPDSSQIAFISIRDGDFEIYVMDADGSNQINLTNNPAFDGAPEWSPDSSQIAFDSDRDGNSEIYVMDADGSNVVRLTNNPAHDQQPAWSPDDSKIAFASGRDGDIFLEIYTMNTDGSDVARLTNSPRFDLDADWGTAPVVEDITPPTLSLPGDIIVNATTADGAQVTFEVSATDETDPIPPVVSCDPVSGSPFPIGTTTVTCTATDEAGNTASGSFDVIVQGATEQVTDLKDEIANLNLPAGTKSSLSATLQQAQSSIEADNVTAALGQLDAFISQVKAQQQRGKLSSQEAAELISSAEQIKVVVGG
jgi:TolB protein